MNPMQEFEKCFNSEITDMLVLIKNSVRGGPIKDNMERTSVDFIAYVNIQTGEVSPEAGRLEWMLDRETTKTGWGYDFEPFQIYHIKARKNIPVPPEPCMFKTINNSYMVVEVLEENVFDSRLDAIKEHAIKPVTIEDKSLGTFVLNRRFSWFEGTVDWLGTECDVSLENDEENEETAKNAYAHLQKLYGNLKEWDEKFRLFAAKELLELANVWYEDEYLDEDEESDDSANEIHITEEEFLRRISVESIIITPDGELTLFYKDDDMFAGHAIQIIADMDGEISRAQIWG